MGPYKPIDLSNIILKCMKAVLPVLAGAAAPQLLHFARSALLSSPQALHVHGFAAAAAGAAAAGFDPLVAVER